MGSRTTWELTQNGKSIYLYSHWGGDSKLEDTQNALLAAKPRWSDETYATRIFISRIIGDDWREETGFGISPEDCFEESYTPCSIDFTNQRITWGDETMRFGEFLGGF